ncbi:hypothetical protein ElyMa_004121100 [Elysia marginata]|uniref:Uncharacterized protein n=1 Tax=Elysia marginata TaxID=1093978 RepID=A0AAV4GDW2_9GAST|nr:hypothetical protein ElyMa_004121100 [Elysia marginata]
MRVTAGVTGCGQRRPIFSTRDVKVTTRTLTQVTLERRNNTDPQQSGSVKRMSGCQEGTDPDQNSKHHWTAAKVTEATSQYAAN